MNGIRRVLSSLAIASALVSTGGALAQSPTAPPAPPGADTRARTDKFFDQMDTNRDGKVTREEMRAFHEKRKLEHQRKFDARFDAADTNRDGALSPDEARTIKAIARHFAEIDANHDGKVTREEVKAWMQAHRRRHDEQPRKS